MKSKDSNIYENYFDFINEIINEINQNFEEKDIRLLNLSIRIFIRFKKYLQIFDLFNNLKIIPNLDSFNLFISGLVNTPYDSKIPLVLDSILNHGFSFDYFTKIHIKKIKNLDLRNIILLKYNILLE
jgi:hypothetical protein